jgi:hypothetical protein
MLFGITLYSTELNDSWEAANRLAIQDSERSSPYSQAPFTCHYPEPVQSSPNHPTFSKIHFNIILPPTFWFSQQSLSFLLSHQNPTRVHLSPIRVTSPTNLIIQLSILIRGPDYTCHINKAQKNKTYFVPVHYQFQIIILSYSPCKLLL